MSTSNPLTITTQWLFDKALKYKRRLIFANIIALIATLISVPIPLLMPLLVDEVLLEKPAGGIAILNAMMPDSWQSAMGYIAMVTFLVVSMRIVSQALNILQTRQFTLIAKQLTCQIREALLDKLGRISMQQYEAKGSGGLTSLLVTDIETIDKFIGSSLSRVVISLLSIIGIAGILLWLDWKLALFIILLNPVIVFLSQAMGRRVKKLKKKENQAFERFQQRLVETLEGLYQLRAANRELDFLNRLKEDANAIRYDSDRFAWQSDAASRLSFLMFLVGFEIFRAAAIVLVFFGDLTVGQIFAVFGYLWFMLSPIQELLNIQYAWFSASAAMKRLNALLELDEEPRPTPLIDPFLSATVHTNKETDNKEANNKQRNNGTPQVSVCFENVNFSYHSSSKQDQLDNYQQVINNLSLTIPAGKKIALVGASGGGKTTLVQLLLGIYQKQSGKIYINGHSIDDVGYPKIRENFAAVLQQPTIFNDTLKGNLTLGAEYSDQQLFNALEVAQLSEFVAQQPLGLDAPLGRQGVRLSGGQRQRLAIARMVLTDPKFVILDEATSALDTQTEAKLHKALHEFLSHRTTLIIAHRLTAVKQADLIYVLEDGKVAQSGNHDSLVKDKGLYQTLYGT
ncbi:ABC transporter ATP-binding protein/permease [Vibrio sp. SS-MA-C1-2]|uniref:ABC transporter ATP-binding protein n=1 Tax=Vibrio sp. SS-MA-C1-2 TaxID=2908646 RepID=UPI001F25EF93|nr:ABC transporter ATP-binding protein [Vibrio sp. SS-MA-C1-2]UJF17339.1 ABC transporter ATP-binding protein/permease [Vibrio sp. SS-MA-C1-2]